MIEFSAAIQSVKVLGDILKSAHELKDSTALISAVNEVQGKLTVAYEAVCNSLEKRRSLEQHTAELEKELNEIKDWKAEAERYRLTEICSGVFAFAIKLGMENGEPPHNICAACHSKRQKGYLQRTKFDGNGMHYKCDRCGSEILDHSKQKSYPSPVVSPPHDYF